MGFLIIFYLLVLIVAFMFTWEGSVDRYLGCSGWLCVILGFPGALLALLIKYPEEKKRKEREAAEEEMKNRNSDGTYPDDYDGLKEGDLVITNYGLDFSLWDTLITGGLNNLTGLGGAFEPWQDSLYRYKGNGVFERVTANIFTRWKSEESFYIPEGYHKSWSGRIRKTKEGD